MYSFIKQDISKHISIYKLTKQNLPLTWNTVFVAWHNDSEFRLFFNSILVNAPFEHFFWETPAFSKATQEQVFEFVLVDALAGFANTTADSTYFNAHFGNNLSIAQFYNLGKDAYLLAPCPIDEDWKYLNLATFVRNAPIEQIQFFWKTLGEVCLEKVQNSPTWLSTAGLGVSWLHLRLDSKPKYYRYTPYKQIVIE